MDLGDPYIPIGMLGCQYDIQLPALVMIGAADTEMLLGHPLHLRRVLSGIHFSHGSALHLYFGEH